VDRPATATNGLEVVRTLEQVRAPEQVRDLDRLAPKESRERALVCLRQVERPHLQVAIADEVVPSAEIDELARPVLGRSLDELDAPLSEPFDLSRKTDVLERRIIGSCRQLDPPS